MKEPSSITVDALEDEEEKEKLLCVECCSKMVLMDGSDGFVIFAGRGAAIERRMEAIPSSSGATTV